MTMLINNSDPEFTPTVVAPGSSDDPFSVNYRGASGNPNVASPATAGTPGTSQVTTADGLQVQPNTTAAPTTTPSTAAPAAPAAPTPVTQSRPIDELLRDPTLAETIAGLVNEKVGTALRSQQSSYDKRLAAQETELKEAREAILRAERNGKLEGLSDDEQDTLKNKWALEDKQRDLEEYETTLDDYWRAMYVAELVKDNTQFGVTAEDLTAFKEPEEMDNFVLRKENEFYRNGGTRQVPTTQVTPGVTPSPDSVPAGVFAPTDVGGSAPSAPPAKLEDGVGMDVMARNMNALKWETLPIPA